MDSTKALINVTNSSSSTTIRVEQFDNRATTCALYEYGEIDPSTPTPQNYRPNVTFSNVRRPFNWITGGGFKTVKIPFNSAGTYDLTLIVNTSEAGNAAYAKSAKFAITVESTFNTGDAGLVWYASLATLINTTYGTFAPPIALQLDVGAVGDGFKVPKTVANFLTLSVPDTYGYVSYVLEPSSYEIV